MGRLGSWPRETCFLEGRAMFKQTFPMVAQHGGDPFRFVGTPSGQSQVPGPSWCMPQSRVASWLDTLDTCGVPVHRMLGAGSDNCRPPAFYVSVSLMIQHTRTGRRHPMRSRSYRLGLGYFQDIPTGEVESRLAGTLQTQPARTDPSRALVVSPCTTMPPRGRHGLLPHHRARNPSPRSP